MLDSVHRSVLLRARWYLVSAISRAEGWPHRHVVVVSDDLLSSRYVPSEVWEVVTAVYPRVSGSVTRAWVEMSAPEAELLVAMIDAQVGA